MNSANEEEIDGISNIKVHSELKNKGYYVDRTFSTKRAIKKTVFSDLNDFIAGSEEQFNELSQKNTNESVHWLLEKEGLYLHQRSTGSIRDILAHLNNEMTQYYSAADLNEFLNQAKRQKLIIVSAPAGSGKSISLVHTAQIIKNQHPLRWVERMDLNENASALKELNGILTTPEDAVEFLIWKMCNLRTKLEVAVFKKQLRRGKCILLLDGFDEISPNYKDKVISLIEQMMLTSIEEIWITTRPHLKNELVEKFNQIPYELVPFTDADQVEFAAKYWRKKFKVKEIKEDRLKVYAEVCVGSLSKSIADSKKTFTGVPLHIRMLSEAFEKEAQSFYSSSDQRPDYFKIDLIDLYKKFFDRKMSIFLTDKSKAKSSSDRSHLALVDTLNSMWDEITPMRYHEHLALKALFPFDEIHLIDQMVTMALKKKPYEQITRYGLVHYDSEYKRYRFVHRTYAEYLVAFFVVKQLSMGCRNHQVIYFIYSDILCNEHSQVIRYFLDGLLASYPIELDEISPFMGDRLHSLWFSKDEPLGYKKAYILRNSVVEGNKRLIRFLRNVLMDGKFKDVSKALLEDVNETPHVSFKDNPFVELLKNDADDIDLFCDLNDRDKNTKRPKETIWHLVAKNGDTELMQLLQEWCKDVDADYLQFLHEKGENELTVAELVVVRGNVNMLEKLAEWKGREELLLFKNTESTTLWHLSVERCQLPVLHLFIDWTKETKVDMKNIITSANEYGQTLVHLAASCSRVEVMDVILQCAEDNNLDLSLILSAKDSLEMSSWHYYAINKNASKESWAALLKWTEKANLDLKTLLLEKNRMGRLCWLDGVRYDCRDTFDRLYSLAEELGLDVKDMLMEKDKYGGTVWHDAASCNNLKLFERLVDCAKTRNIDLKYVLDDITDFDESVWEAAMRLGYDEMLERLFELAAEVEFDAKSRIKDAMKNCHFSKETIKIIGCIFRWLAVNEMNLKDLLGEERVQSHIDVPETIEEACIKYWFR